jgi:hypothetical protein
MFWSEKNMEDENFFIAGLGNWGMLKRGNIFFYFFEKYFFKNLENFLYTVTTFSLFKQEMLTSFPSNPSPSPSQSLPNSQSQKGV